MIRQKISLFGKILWIVPYVLLISMSDIFLAVPTSQPLPDMLWYRIFGRLSAGELHTVILSIKSIGGIFLFVLLYGSCISDYFGTISVFVFTRVNNRKIWCIKKAGELCLFSMLYSFLLIAVHFVIGFRNVNEWRLDGSAIITFAVIWGIIMPLLAVVCLAVNWISIPFDVPIAVFLVFVVVMILEFVAILLFDNIVNVILNPLCFNILIINNPVYAIMKILIEVLYLLLIMAGMMFYVKYRDIF